LTFGSPFSFFKNRPYTNKKKQGAQRNRFEKFLGKFFAWSVRLVRPCLSSIYGENGRQATNMAELQDGISKPGEFAKMQSPGEGRLMKFFGAAEPQHRRSAPVKGGSGMPITPARLTRGANEPESKI